MSYPANGGPGFATPPGNGHHPAPQGHPYAGHMYSQPQNGAGLPSPGRGYPDGAGHGGVAVEMTPRGQHGGQYGQYDAYGPQGFFVGNMDQPFHGPPPQQQQQAGAAPVRGVHTPQAQYALLDVAREGYYEDEGYIDERGQFVPYEDAYYDGEYKAGAPTQLVDYRGRPLDGDDGIAKYTLEHAPMVVAECPPRPPPKPPVPPAPLLQPPRAPGAIPPRTALRALTGTLKAGRIISKRLAAFRQAQAAASEGKAAQPDGATNGGVNGGVQPKYQLLEEPVRPASWAALSPARQDEWLAQQAYVQQYNARVMQHAQYERMVAAQRAAYDESMRQRRQEAAAQQVLKRRRRSSGVEAVMNGLKAIRDRAQHGTAAVARFAGGGHREKARLTLKTVGKLVATGTEAARKRRTANIARLMDVGHLGDGNVSLFPKDCFNKKLGVSLSRSKVVYENDHSHPRRAVTHENDEGEMVTFYERFSVCGTHTGGHGACCRKTSDLGSLGLGVQLYFKYLKLMGVVFLLMSLVTLPTLLMFYTAETDASEQFEKTGLVGFLGRTTMGQLGQGRTVCMEAGTSGEAHIDCGTGATIGLVEAYYGNPTGSCTCPVERRPVPDCPAVEDDGVCSPLDGFCFLGPRRSVNTPSGLSFTAGPCCSSSQRFNDPDFSDLDIGTTSTCASSTAQVLAVGKCLGRESCTISGAAHANQTWPQPVEGEGVKHSSCTGDSVAEGVVATANSTCTTSLLAAGNFTHCPDRLKLMVVARCFDTEVALADGSIVVDKDDIARLVGWLDFASVVIFITGLLYLRHYENIEGEVHDLATISADDYTVEVTNLPPHDSVPKLERELKHHFEAVLNTEKPSPLATAIQHVLGKKFNDPILVADINCGTNISGRVTRALTKRGVILKKIAAKERKVQQRLRKEQERLEKLGKSGQPQRTELERKTLLTLLAKLDTVDDEITLLEQTEVDAVIAYVTFADEEGRLRALSSYGHGCCNRLCQAKRKRMNGRALDLQRAPQPSDIIWENLGVSGANRCWRTMVTLLVTVLLLLVSVVLVFVAEDQKRAAKREFPPADCASMTDVLNATLVVEDVKWRELNLTVGGLGRLECFCKELFFTSGPNALLDTLFNVPILSSQGSVTGYQQEDWCVDWLQAFTRITVLTYGASVTVLLVNALLRRVVLRLVTFERHASKTSAMVSRFTKLFVSTALNIGVVMLLVNAHLDVEVELLRRGEHKDVGPDWFFTVGTSMLVTMLLNLFMPHAWPLFIWGLKGFQRCCDRGCSNDYSRTRKMTQQSLEALYTGPRFLLAERYAQHCMFIFVTMTYSTGMPLLYAITMVSFVLTYWLDKYLLLTLYKSPPHYTDEFSNRARLLMPLAIVLHLGMAIWTLGNTKVFAPDSVLVDATQATETITGDVGDASGVNVALASLAADGTFASERLRSSHVLPLVILMVVMVVFLVIYNVLWRLAAGTMMTLAASCKLCPRISFEFLPHYFDSIKTAVKVDAIVSHMVKPNVFRDYCDGLTADDFAARPRADAEAGTPSARRPSSVSRTGSAGSFQDLRFMTNPMSSPGALQRELDAKGGKLKPTESARARSRRKSQLGHQKLLDTHLSKLAAHSELDRCRYMSGLVSYDVSANPEYRTLFGLNQPLAEHLKRGAFWAERGTEWARLGVDVLRVPKRPFRWELHRLRASVKEQITSPSKRANRGVAATLAQTLRGSSSPGGTPTQQQPHSPGGPLSPGRHNARSPHDGVGPANVRLQLPAGRRGNGRGGGRARPVRRAKR